MRSRFDGRPSTQADDARRGRRQRRVWTLRGDARRGRRRVDRSALAAIVCAGMCAALGAPASAATFSNTTPFTITDSPAECVQQPASAYPSQIAVSGLPGVVTDVNVTITGFSHEYPADVRMLLVGPGGQSTVLYGETGGTDSGSPT